jgi:hypothetical protein
MTDAACCPYCGFPRDLSPLEDYPAQEAMQELIQSQAAEIRDLRQTVAWLRGIGAERSAAHFRPGVREEAQGEIKHDR